MTIRNCGTTSVGANIRTTTGRRIELYNWVNSGRKARREIGQIYDKTKRTAKPDITTLEFIKHAFIYASLHCNLEKDLVRGTCRVIPKTLSKERSKQEKLEVLCLHRFYKRLKIKMAPPWKRSSL